MDLGSLSEKLSIQYIIAAVDTEEHKHLARQLAIALTIACILLVVRTVPHFTPSDHIDGSYEERFKPVYEAFRQNFAEGREWEGGNLAVYHRGKLVVNLWGGYADRESNRLWSYDTKTMVFSATKAVASLCVAMLVDRGRAKFGDLVTKHWPAYGKFGKGNTTIEHILSHKAGLPIVSDVRISLSDARDIRRMEKILENSMPVWEPGEATGYHAITFGWLVDILVRKMDEKQRGIKQFVREELGLKHGIDFDIGASRDALPHVARISNPTLLHYIRETVIDPRHIVMFAILYLRSADALMWKVLDNPDWIKLDGPHSTINSPEIVQLDLASVTGVTRANDFARIFALAMDGTLLSNATLEQLTTPLTNYWHIEQVVRWPIVKGYGFFLERHPTREGKWLVGHPGYGGQSIMFDTEHQLSIAYISNGLKTGSGELCGTYQRIQRAIYDVIDDNR